MRDFIDVSFDHSTCVRASCQLWRRKSVVSVHIRRKLFLEHHAQILRTEQRNKSGNPEQDPIDENVIQHPTRILDMNQSGAAPKCIERELSAGQVIPVAFTKLTLIRSVGKI